MFFLWNAFIFMPPFEKRGIFFCTCRSVGRSVDIAMAAQYLLTPLLESCQTWYSKSLWGIDDLYCFLSHIVKGQGQTAGL